MKINVLNGDFHRKIHENPRAQWRFLARTLLFHGKPQAMAIPHAALDDPLDPERNTCGTEDETGVFS